MRLAQVRLWFLLCTIWMCFTQTVLGTDLLAQLTFPTSLNTIGSSSTPPVTLHLLANDEAFWNFSRPTPIRNRWQYQFNYNISAGSTTFLSALHSCSSQCATPLPSNPYVGGPYIFDVETGLNGLKSVSAAYNLRFPNYYSFTAGNSGSYPYCLCNDTTTLTSVGINEVWYFRSGPATVDTDITGTATVIDICDGHGDELPIGDTNGCTCDPGWFGNQCGTNSNSNKVTPCCSNEVWNLDGIANVNTNLTMNSSLNTPERSLQPYEKIFTYTPNSSFNVTGGINYLLQVYNKNASNPKCQSVYPSYGFRIFGVAVCDATLVQSCYNSLLSATSGYGTYDATAGPYYPELNRWNSGDSVDFTFGVNTQRQHCGCVNSYSQTWTLNKEVSILYKIAAIDPTCDYDISLKADQFCLNGGTYYYNKGCSCRSGFGGVQCQTVCTGSLGGPDCASTVYALTNGVPFTFSSSIYANQTYFTFQSPPPAPNGNQRFLQIKVTGEVNNPTGVRIAGKEHCDSATCPINYPSNIDPTYTYMSATDSIWPFDFGVDSYSGTPAAYATFVQEGRVDNSEFIAGMPTPSVTARTACGCSGKNASDSSYIENWNILFTHLNVVGLATQPTNTFTITITSFDVCNGHGQYDKSSRTCSCDSAYPRGPNNCGTPTSYRTPCCVACQNTDPSIAVALNCSDVVSVASTIAGMTMPVTQPNGPQVPGQLSRLTATVFPNERAVFRYTTVPQNPRGNPWMFQFHTSTTWKQTTSTYGYSYYLYSGGVRTCSTSTACMSLIPETINELDYTWPQDQSQVLLQQPMDIGNFDISDNIYLNSLAISFQELNQVKLEFNPSSYYLRNDSSYHWQYEQVKVGNNTAIPSQCLCELSYFQTQTGASAVSPVASTESWTFATSYLSNPATNEIVMSGNFSDICAGHGSFDGSSFGCTCDSGYYGYGCGSPSYATPYGDPNYYYYTVTKPTPVSQCCAGQIIRSVTPTIYANGTSSVVQQTTTIPITSSTVFISGDPKSESYINTQTNYVGLIAYDLDPTHANTGLSLTFRFTTSNASSLTPGLQLAYSSDYYFKVYGYMVCNSWTVEQCFNWLTLTGETGRDGTWDGIQYYNMRSTEAYSYCGCTEPSAIPKQVMFLVVWNQASIIDFTPTSAIMDCDPIRGIWNMTDGVGTCVCTNGFEGAGCLTRPIRQIGTFQFSASDTQLYGANTLDLQVDSVDTLSSYSQAVVLAYLPIGQPIFHLNLNMTASCASSSFGVAWDWRMELMRCFDQPNRYLNQVTNSTDLNAMRYYSPSETFAYASVGIASTLNALSIAGKRPYNGDLYPWPDNPFRHCDYGDVSTISSFGPTLSITNSPRSFVLDGPTFTAYQSVSSEVLSPQGYSPCATGDSACTNSTTYYVIRVVNMNGGSSGCTLRMRQTTGFTCRDSFIPCGAGSSGCISTNSTSAPSVCGPCNDGTHEGIGCLGERASFLEIFNQQKVTFTSKYGEPMRFSLQVSPSNTIAFKLTFSTNINCTSSACRNHVGKVWIRGRLGSPPPALNTHIVTDEISKTVYVDSDGTDSELTSLNITTPSAAFSATLTNGSYDSSSSTGTVAQAHSSFRTLFSFDGSGDDFESSQAKHWSHHLLSYFYSPLAENAPSFDHALKTFTTTSTLEPDPSATPVYRNDDLNTNPDSLTTLNFPAEAKYGGTRLVANSFLYIEVYHGNMLDASTSSTGRLDDSGSGTYDTNMQVEVVINDSLGTLVGWIAVAILGGFAFFVLCYLIYLRCRYGSITDGVEVSIITKAKVSREVHPTKSPEQLFKEKQERKRKRMERLAKGKTADEEDEPSSCAKVLLIIPLVIAFVLLLTFEVLKVLFNISILHQSVGSYLPVVDFDKVTAAVNNALDRLGVARLKAVWDTFNSFFDFLGIFNQVSLKWNCGGALSMFAPVVILLGAIVLVVVLQKDYFLRFSLSLKGSSEGTSKVGRKLRAAIATVLSTLLLYFLQSSILVLTQVVASTWNIKRSCSANDATLVYIGRWLCIVFIVLLFYVAGLMFAGIRTLNFQSLVIGWFSGVWALLQLTVGIWRHSTIERFDIAARARDFDLDDNHDENPEEAVMELQAASRGLMWTAFPVGIVLTKVTEQINAPPVFLIGNYLGVDITTPRWNRWLKWSVGMGKMLAVFYTVWSASQLVVLIALGLTALSVCLVLILPSDYHRKKWKATHKVADDIDVVESPTQQLVASIDITGELTFPTSLNAIGATSTPPVTLHLLANTYPASSAYFNFSRPPPIRNRWLYQFHYNISAGSTSFLTALHSCSPQCATPQPSTPYGYLGGSYLYDVAVSLGGGLNETSAGYNPRWPSYGFPFTASNSGTGNNGTYPYCLCNDTTTLTSVGVNEVWYFRSGPATVDTDITGTATVIDICDGHGDELPIGDTNGCTCDPGWFGNQCGTNSNSNKVTPCCSNEVWNLDAIANVNTNLTLNSSLNTPERSLQPYEKIFTYTPNSSFNVTGGINYLLQVYNKNASNPKCQSVYPSYGFRVFGVAVCNATLLQSCYNSLVNTHYEFADADLYAFNMVSEWNSGAAVEFTFGFDTARKHCGCCPPLIPRVYDLSLKTDQFCLNGGTYYYGKGCSCRSGFGGVQCQNACTGSLGGPNCTSTVYTLSNGVPFTFSSSIYDNQTYFTFQSPPPAPNGNQRFLQIKVTGEANNPTGIRIAGKEHCDAVICPINYPMSIDSADAYYLPSDSIWPFDPYFGSHSVTFREEGMAGAEFIAGMPIPAVTPRTACGCAGKNASAADYIESWNFIFTHLNLTGLGTLPTNTFTITVTSYDVCNGHGQYHNSSRTCTCDTDYPRGPNSCGTTTAFRTPCCQACQNTDPSLPFALNCSDVLSVVSTTTGMTMPVTQSVGPQLSGQLPRMAVTVFPNERAIFRYTTMPQNPRGNPWVFQFHNSIAWNQFDPFGSVFYLYFGGVRTCSTSTICMSLVPKTINALGYTWTQVQTQVLMQQPMDMYSQYMTMDFNPSSYYLRNDSIYLWQYEQVKVGTAIPPQCLCELSYFHNQTGASAISPVASTESWTFATSYLSNGSTNEMLLDGNFSDICGGHGFFDGSSYGCSCDSGYYGFACGQPTFAEKDWSIIYNYLWWELERPATPLQCCTGQITRSLTPIIYANGTSTIVQQTTTIPITSDAEGPWGSYVGLIAYDIDPTYANTGLSFIFRFNTSNVSSLVPGVQLAVIGDYFEVYGYMICNNWTVSQCYNWFEGDSNHPADGSFDGYEYYYMLSTDAYSHCGCSETAAIPRQVMFLLEWYKPSIIDITPVSAVMDCDPARGQWNMTGGVGSCICMIGFTGTNCLTRVDLGVRQIGTFQYSPAATQLYGAHTQVLEVDGFDTPSGTPIPGVVLAYLPIGAPILHLNLSVTVSCNTSVNNEPYYIEVELMRCFDQPNRYLNQITNSTDPNAMRYYSPNETFAFASAGIASTLFSLSITSQPLYNSTLHPWPDNPFRHCDYGDIPGISASGHATNAPTSLILNGPGFYRIMTPQAYSPCVNGVPVTNTFTTYPDPACVYSNTYYAIRVINENYGSAGCTLRMHQTAGFTCSNSFVPCGSASSGCLASNSTTAPSACGPCADDVHGGIGCLGEKTSFLEIFNQQKVTFTSKYGEPMRFSLQVSPSNTIAFKLTFSTNINCNSSACRNHVGKVWIRGRLGSAPPTLNTRVVTDEIAKTVYVDSDGTDSELTSLNSTTTLSVPSSSTDTVAQATHESTRTFLSFGGSGDDESSQSRHWSHHLLSYFYSSHAENAPSLDHALKIFATASLDVDPSATPVYRNDDLTTKLDLLTINFPAEARYGGTKVVANSFLYIEVYHGNMLDASTSSTGRLDDSGSGTYDTNMQVEVVINDSLGTLVGWIAVAILGGFAFFVICYLVYLRCRYGSISDGVEGSILTKAKVSREVHPTKSPEELLKLKEARKRRKVMDEEEKPNPRQKVMMFVPLVIAFVLLLTFEVLKVLFNISILHQSVGSSLPVVDFDKVTAAVNNALDGIGIARLKAAWDTFNSFFDFLGIFNQVSLKWNCGGALSMFAPVVILLGAIVLVVVLQKDYFLRFSLSLKGSSEGTHKVGRKLRAAIATVVSTILLYFLQSSILVLTQVVASTWNIKRSCSANDATLVYVGRWLCIIFIVLLFYVAGLMFAGIKSFNFQSLVVGWFTGVWALLQLTVGVWRQSTVARFDIAARARDFDLDDNHDENPEEAVMELQAASRGLMWTAFPVGIVLTKLTEQINAPPVFLIGSNLGVDITTPRWNRWLRWSVGMGKMIAVFYTVWFASRVVVLIALGLTALSVCLVLILPSDYHRKKWQAMHQVADDPDVPDLTLDLNTGDTLRDSSAATDSEVTVPVATPVAWGQSKDERAPTGLTTDPIPSPSLPISSTPQSPSRLPPFAFPAVQSFN